MTTPENPIRWLVSQQAIEWHLAHRLGLDRPQAAEFADWLKASPLHVEEYLAIAQLAGELRTVGERLGSRDETAIDALVARARASGAPADVVELPVSRRPRSRGPSFGLRFAPFGAAAACALAIFWLLPATASLHRASGHGQRLSERLPDASLVTLDADTVADVSYTLGERRIALQSGQGLFEVAHNRWRPFRVQAGAVVVTAVGTKFNVELHEGVTVVSVLEGRVRVAPLGVTGSGVTGSGVLPPVEVGAGEQLRVVGGQLTAARPVADVARAVAWLDGRLDCDELPLADVAAEVSRYSDRPVTVTGTALRALPISGAFTASDLDAFLAFARSLEGAQVRVSPERIEIAPR
jgi:transmembrane sensor